MANGNKQSIYEFGEFRLDASQLMLYKGGSEITLPPKAVETLVMLVENHGQIVGKDELMKRVWGDTAVEESNLSQYLYLLRRSLGSGSDGSPSIETLRRRGYRFGCDVPVYETSAPGLADGHLQGATESLRAERHGNVLKLAEWRPIPEAKAPEPEVLSAGNPAGSAEKGLVSKGWLAVIILSLAGVGAVLFYIWETGQTDARSTAVRGDLTFTRLTDGIVPIDAAISPDGKYFAYTEGNGEASRLLIQQTGQTNRHERLPFSKRSILSKTFSRDSQFIYFLGIDPGETQASLYQIPTLGGPTTRILANIESAVSFSPDGTDMVFNRSDSQTGESALVVASKDGDRERIVELRQRGEEILRNPAWSPDGEWIAFASLPPHGDAPNVCLIKKLSLRTGKIEHLSSETWGACHRIAWTRDGEGVVFIGTRLGDWLTTRRDNIYFVSVQSGEARRITVDGSRYQLYSLGVSDDNAIISVPNSSQSQIWRMSPSGDATSAVQITHGLSDGRAGLAPLPDGRVGYIARSAENLHVWLMNSDGSDPRQVSTQPSMVEELRAAPDGSYFVFSGKDGTATNLYRIDTDGSHLHQLTNRDDVGVDATISPDSSWIVYNSGVFDGTEPKHALWKVSAAGGEPANLSDTDCTVPHFSPDGKLLSCVGGSGEILIIDAESGEVIKRLETHEASVLNNGAHWTPDGQNLVYKVSLRNVSNLWMQPLDGGPKRQLTDFTTNGVHNFAYSHDGSALYVVRIYQNSHAVLITNF
jgi:Tol biopolymer transport system component/DNA-binding winged helix-turn-helix (wHTH) protein